MDKKNITFVDQYLIIRMLRSISLTILLWFSLYKTIIAQSFNHLELKFEPITINGWLGVHSYSYGTWKGKIIIVGGRRDGIHARQPFKSFPQSKNNTYIYILDIENKQVDSIDLAQFSTNISEHLQASNQQFYQFENHLIIVGGYAYSESMQDHISFPYITTIDLKCLLDTYEVGIDKKCILQKKENKFAITGGQMAKIKNKYLIIGGHSFHGRYNPINAPSFTQEYVNGIVEFNLKIKKDKLKVSTIKKRVDELHLHRRDFNLTPSQINGVDKFILHSGVFQIHKEAPFLYPVEISESGHLAKINNYQYLSNYHSGKITFTNDTEEFTYFLGGISKFYLDNKNRVIEDELVPFTKGISAIDQKNYKEYHYESPMPELIGAAGEVVAIHNLEKPTSPFYNLQQWNGESIDIAYLVGGLKSDIDHPFQMNSVESQSRPNNVIYKISIKQNLNKDYLKEVSRKKVEPNISIKRINSNVLVVECESAEDGIFDLYFQNEHGKVAYSEKDINIVKGKTTFKINNKNIAQVNQALAIYNGNEFIKIAL